MRIIRFFVFLFLITLFVDLVNCDDNDVFNKTTQSIHTDGVKKARDGLCGDNVKWTLSDEGVLTISGTGRMNHYTDRPDNLAPWYTQRSSIKNIIIEKGVASIGDYAFFECFNLAQVSIPDGVTLIGDSAFRGDLDYGNKLTKVNIPDSVTSIRASAFRHCTSLTEVNIPHGVTSIGNSVFSHCTSLTEVNIPDGVTKIEENAFYHCSSLTKVNIPHGVTKIEKNIFSQCSSLTKVNIPDNVTSIEDSAFSECSSLTEVSIPAGVTSIGSAAFKNCSSLRSIEIPAALRSIEDHTFSGCTNLTNVVIGESVTNIGDDAFEGCNKLTNISIPASVIPVGMHILYELESLKWIEVEKSNKDYKSVDGVLYNQSECLLRYPPGRTGSFVVPDGVKVISDNAFKGSRYLVSVTIPSSVTSIGYHAFEGCNSLASFEVKKGNKQYASIEGLLFNHNYTILVKYPAGRIGTSYTIPDYVESIEGNGFFESVHLNSLVIGDSVVSIGDNAFSKCSNLSTVLIGDNVSSIGNNAFGGCNNLKSVFYQGSDDIPGSLIFDSCDALENICVSPDYGSPSFCGVNVSFASETCKTFMSMFDHCYKASYIDGTFIQQKRKNATQSEEKMEFGCVHYQCQNETGELTQYFFCEEKACSEGTCGSLTGECTYKIIEGREELVSLENACFEVACVENMWVIQKRSNASEWEKKTNDCEVYECDNETGFKTRVICSSDKFDSMQNSSVESDPSIPFWAYIIIGVCAAAVIITAINLVLLRARLCRQKESFRVDDDANVEEEMTITMNGKPQRVCLREMIGKGSFGTVWLAQAGDLTLAVKEMERQDEKEMEYEKEMSIMSQLDSKYVVRVYGSSVTDSSFFIAMEYVPLGSLSTAFENNAFSAYMRCRFMLDVAHGMEYLHSQGIVHRDLKPGNVLVSSLDPNAEVLCKISDFGESRKGLEETHTLTMTRGVGSPYYMSPEMLRGDDKYTRAVDVFSFAIVCVELWNEQLPYSETHFDTPYAFALYVLQGHRPEIRKDCPTDLVDVITHCWTTDRLGRPPFTTVTKDMACVVENARKSTPEGTEHVKARKTCVESKQNPSTNLRTQNRNKKPGTRKNNRTQTSANKDTEDLGDVHLDDVV